MTTLIHSARLIDPASGTDITGGLLIEDGLIADIGPHLTASTKADDTIDAAGDCLAPGLIDLSVKTGEPGEEHRETLETASKAAVSGGITSMVVAPDTQPVLDDVALIQFVYNRGADTALNRIYPAGALTKGLAGEAMAEIGLLAEAGAVLFTNGDRPVANLAILRRAMTYAAAHGAIISSRPDDIQLTGSGVMNAGGLASRLGLKGIPAISEAVALQRDMLLAENSGVRLLIDQISTAKSLDSVRHHKSVTDKLSCSVAAYNLFFNELDVGDYLTYCKLNPPFRTEDDRLALISGLGDGTVDYVVSAHNPQPPEDKRLPFGEASFGGAGLETLLSVLLGLVADGQVSMIDALRAVTSNPAELLGLPQGRLAAGAPADLILFDPEKPWLCERENLLSRSTNSPFDGRRLIGRVNQTFVAGQSVFKR